MKCIFIKRKISLSLFLFQLRRASFIAGISELVCNNTALEQALGEVGFTLRNTSVITQILCGKPGSVWYDAMVAAGIHPLGISEIADIVS